MVKLKEHLGLFLQIGEATIAYEIGKVVGQVATAEDLEILNPSKHIKAVFGLLLEEFSKEEIEEALVNAKKEEGLPLDGLFDKVLEKVRKNEEVPLQDLMAFFARFKDVNLLSILEEALPT